MKLKTLTALALCATSVAFARDNLGLMSFVNPYDLIPNAEDKLTKIISILEEGITTAPAVAAPAPVPPAPAPTAPAVVDSALTSLAVAAPAPAVVDSALTASAVEAPAPAPNIALTSSVISYEFILDPKNIIYKKELTDALALAAAPAKASAAAPAPVVDTTLTAPAAAPTGE
jgi:hypothetical protein